uniref:Uncharacterized protein n=1 Tax=Solanum lycopersicum TaxID=4081 RepID=A0A3Q7JXC6_SOLLC
MGYIKLACLLTHVWYLKRIPNNIVNLIDKPLKELEGLVHYDILSNPITIFLFSMPITKKTTLLRLQGLLKYEIQSLKYIIPLFFTTQGFITFRNREISTGAEWEELGQMGTQGMNRKIEKLEEERTFWLDAWNWLRILFEQL